MLVGFLGLGKMGSRIVTKLVEDDHNVIAWNRSFIVSQNLQKELRIKNYELRIKEEIRGVVLALKKPRILWLMLPAGTPTEQILREVSKYIEKEDVVIDGANSFYQDTEKRFAKFEKAGIHFLGIGVSGGIHAPVNGFPLMVGGSEKGYNIIQPILETLSKPYGGFAYFGKGGVGHFVKMVHNGVEYGMMQAIGEGFGVLDKGPYKLDLEKVATLWTKNTIVAGFLMEMAKNALQKDAKLSKTSGFIEENGEAKWTIALAKKLKIPIKIIEDSLKFRQQSQKSLVIQKTFAAKMVAALRHEFGGHKVKENNL